MRNFWRRLRRRPPEPSDEALRAVEDASHRVEEANVRKRKADAAAGQLDAYLRANHFDNLLTNAMRPRS